MSKERLDYQKLCPNHYSNYEDGCCMESCEFYNRNECPVVYVNGLIADLKAKLAEKETEIGFLEATTISMQEDIDYWEKQLEEKEQELNKFKSIGATPRQLQRAYQERYKYNERCSELKKQHIQNKINFAVEKLEEVYDKFISDYVDCKDFSELFCGVTNFLDNQIKAIKEMMESE